MNNVDTKTILLVEDEAIISIVISKTITRFGYNVISASSGERAVEIAASDAEIHLILMDIELGNGIDGTVAAQRILEIRNIPIVFHTSHSEREMVERVRGITRYGYVIKSSGDFVLQSSIEMAFELVEAHKKIKASEEHFYGMFEKAPLGYQSLDEDGNFIEVNQTWLETLGYSSEEVHGRWFGDFLAPEYVEAFRERFPIFKAAGKIHSEFQMIHKNGGRRYIAFEGRISHKDDGSFQQTHCILSDITERKTAEAALQKIEIENKALLGSMINAFVLFESVFNDAGEFVSYRFIYINEAYEKITGVKNDEVYGKTVHEVWPGTEESWVKKYGEVAVTGVTDSFEMYHDPTKKIYHCNVYRPGEAKDRFCVVFEDITDRKKAEEAIKIKNEELETTNEELNAAMEEMEATNEELAATNERLLESEREVERSEELFRSLSESSTDYIMVYDREKRHIYANKAALEVSGTTWNGFVGKTHREMGFDADLCELWEDKIQKVFDTGESQSAIFGWESRNGKVTLDWRVTPIFSKDGTVSKVLGISRDISAYKQVEDELKSSRALLNETEKTGKIGGWEFDVETLTQKWTEETFRILEIDYVEGEPVVPEGINYFAPESRSAAEQAINRAIENGEPYNLDLEIITAKGNRRWVHASAKVRMDNGKTRTVYGSFQDITDRKLVEEKLRKSEARYSAALAAVDDGIWEWNTSDGSAYFNSQYYNMLGYNDGEFSATYDIWRTMVYPDDLERVEHDLRESVDSGRKFNIDLRMKMKSGEWLWVCTRGKAVEWDSMGKALLMVGTLSDVTLRKNAELELRSSQDKLKRIIENSSELICEIDDKGIYTFVSKRYQDILGYNPYELLGTPVAGKMHPDDIAAAVSKHDILKSKTGISVDEWRFMHRDGNYRTFECRGSVYLDEDGAAKTVVVSHDITESKQIEDTQLFLIVSGSPLSGEGDFFQSLARYLAESLDMDYVCIDRLVGGGLSAKTVAVYYDGEFEDNVEYTLKDTPCGDVAGKTICTFSENVSGKFPNDQVLQDMGAESYAGVTLWSSTGEPIGLIAVIGRKKMKNTHLAESILKIVAIRAAGELERRDAEEKIKNLLKEKELILQEVHHRIKNNMNTISGLLALQESAMEVPAAVDALGDARSRVQSMMVLYDKLYRSDDFKEVSVKEYLPALISEITVNFPNSRIVKIESSIEDFILDVKILVPLGIIVNEIITNIMKYAFSGRDSGIITASAAFKDGHAIFALGDNGIGIPESITIENSTGFGMQLVGMLTEQIGGKIKIQRGDGTRFILEFDV